MNVVSSPAPEGGPPSLASPAVPYKRPGGRIKGFFAVLLMIVGVLCLSLAPLAIWGRDLVLNTNSYVATVAPLASNPGVQDAVVAQVDKQVEANLPVSTYVKQVLPARAASLLAVPIQSAIYGLIHTAATKVVQSRFFARFWVAVNRLGHRQLVAILTGKKLAGGILYIKSGRVVLDLGAVVEQVKDQLIGAGLTIAAHIPVVSATLEIGQVKGVEHAQRLVRVLNTLADWLPWMGLALVAAGVALARRHRRALVGAALGLCVAMIIVGIGLFIGRDLYANGIPTDVMPRTTAYYIYDTLVRYLRLSVRLIFVVGLLVALGVWVSGPSPRAVGVRRWVLTNTRHFGEDHPAGPVSIFVARYTNPLRIGVLGLAALVLLLLSGPTATAVIILVVVVAVLLLAIEALRAPAAHSRVDQA
jgi:hypothetical protein